MSQETLVQESEIITEHWEEAQISRMEVKNPNNTIIAFIPGAGHNGAFFHNYINELGSNANMRAIAMDYRGSESDNVSNESVKGKTLGNYKDSTSNTLAKIHSELGPNEELIVVSHSMAGRIVHELSSEERLPESVKGIVYLNPVTDDFSFQRSALKSTFTHMFESIQPNLTKFQPTPFSFLKHLVFHTAGDFFKGDMKRFFNLFLSSEPEDNDFRLAKNLDPQTVKDKILSPESSSAIMSILWRSSSRVKRSKVPLLFVGGEKDKITPLSDVRKFFERNKKVTQDSSFAETEGSHNTSIDICGTSALERHLIPFIKRVTKKS